MSLHGTGKQAMVSWEKTFWKQAYKISNVAWSYSQFAPEVPSVKGSNGAARGGRRAVLVCRTAAEVNL